MTRAAGRVGLGVIGLGRAFTLMLPTFTRDERFELVAAATPGVEGRRAFEREFGGSTYADAADLVRDEKVEAVYVASPHEFHCEHVVKAAAAGRHVLVDKPLAVSMEDAERMVSEAARHGVHVIVGPSHSFDAPVLKARAVIESGRVGAVRMIHAFNYTDFLYRPRRPEELDTGRGGGVVFSQAVHQIDVARLLAGGQVVGVRALTGNWDPTRPTEGAYSALVRFQGGAFASLTYSGYARFDSDEFMGWIGELGRRKSADDYGRARRLLKGAGSAKEEVALKRARNFGLDGGASAAGAALPDAHEHFGPVIVSCEAADLRLTPEGVWLYADDEREFLAVDPPTIPRVEVMDELYAAVVRGVPPVHSGAWGLASLEVALGLLESARTGDEVDMKRQVGVAEKPKED